MIYNALTAVLTFNYLVLTISLKSSTFDLFNHIFCWQYCNCKLKYSLNSFILLLDSYLIPINAFRSEKLCNSNTLTIHVVCTVTSERDNTKWNRFCFTSVCSSWAQQTLSPIKSSSPALGHGAFNVLGELVAPHYKGDCQC